MYDLSWNVYTVQGKNFPPFLFRQHVKSLTPSAARKPLSLLRHSLKCYFKPQWNQWKDSKWLSQPLDEALIRHSVPCGALGYCVEREELIHASLTHGCGVWAHTEAITSHPEPSVLQQSSRHSLAVHSHKHLSHSKSLGGASLKAQQGGGQFVSREEWQ